MSDEEEDRLAAEVVSNWRSLRVQNDGVLRSLIRDALHHAVTQAEAKLRQELAPFMSLDFSTPPLPMRNFSTEYKPPEKEKP